MLGSAQPYKGTVVNPRRASSQAAWALLTEGVTRARVETHRIQHLINRAMKLVDTSEEKDHLYQVAGDIILALPTRMEQLAIVLDRTGLALSKMGIEFLDARLPLSDKQMVEEAVSAAFGGKTPRKSMTARVADRYMEKVQ